MEEKTGVCARKNTHERLCARARTIHWMRRSDDRLRSIAPIRKMKDSLQPTPRCDVSPRARVARACCFIARSKADQPIRAIANNL